MFADEPGSGLGYLHLGVAQYGAGFSIKDDDSADDFALGDNGYDELAGERGGVFLVVDDGDHFMRLGSVQDLPVIH